MSTATEIPHGTVSGNRHYGCKCLACCDAYATYQRRRHRLKAYGAWEPLVDATPAREHLEALHARGMSWEQIARASGVLVEELRRLRLPMGGRSRPDRIRKERAELLLALRFDPAPDRPQALVLAIGTARRLQALRVIGWPMGELSRRSGLSKQSLGKAAGRQMWVKDSTRLAVAELYEDLSDQDPRRHGCSEETVAKVAAWAAPRKWAAPNRWLSSDIDDPGAKPGPAEGLRYTTPSAGDRRQAIVDDTAELAAQGCTRETIAARLGITWDAVQKAHSRTGTPLPRVSA